MSLLRTLVRRRLFVTLPLALVAILTVASFTQSSQLTTSGSSHHQTTTLQPVDSSGSKVLAARAGDSDSNDSNDDNTGSNTGNRAEGASDDATPTTVSGSSSTTQPPANTPIASPTPAYKCACVYPVATDPAGTPGCAGTCPTPPPYGGCGTCGGPIGGYRPHIMCPMVCMQ